MKVYIWTRNSWVYTHRDNGGSLAADVEEYTDQDGNKFCVRRFKSADGKKMQADGNPSACIRYITILPIEGD